jgi:hypothetical protein
MEFTTNGMLTAYEEEIGMPGSPATFNQYGGTNIAGSYVRVKGTYNVSEGRLQAFNGSIVIGENSSAYAWIPEIGTLNQSGGVVDGPLVLGSGGRGFYNLSGGLRAGGATILGAGGWPGSGRIVQTGGTNQAGAIQMNGNAFTEAWESSYTLFAGEVRSTTLDIPGFGSFVQYGGLHINQSITLSSRFTCRYRIGRDPDCRTVYGYYSLDGGVLRSSSISGPGLFVQTGGQLKADQIGQTRFRHMGGQLTVTELASEWFWQDGGELTVSNIIVKGLFEDIGGTVNHRGSISIRGGWHARSGKLTLGPLSFTDGWIYFPINVSALTFRDSSRMTWSNQTGLIVGNWNGSWTGGGLHQLRFGHNANGLAPTQLGRIFFAAPCGNPGFYPARILTDGEVVPIPKLVVENCASELRLHWPEGFILQSATNVNGPFEDLFRGTNSSFIPSSDPCRFFRLRPASQ